MRENCVVGASSKTSFSASSSSTKAIAERMLWRTPRLSGGHWKMVKRSPRRPVTITPAELARRYLDGASLDDLGVLCGCTATRIRRILVAQGVEIRPRGHNHGNGRSTKFVRR
jgi:hypothetical protein